MKKVSIIYSFRNEVDVLDELIRRTNSVLEKNEYEIIFVNDASTDGSLEKLQTYANHDKRIKIINMSNRFGQMQCLVAGIQNATGDAVIYCDCDLQDPPELFLKMIEQWKSGAEVVNMKRILRKGESLLKMRLTKIGYSLWSKLSKVTIPVEVGDFKLLDKKVYEKVAMINEEDPFLRGYTQWLGYRQVTLEYEREARHSGITHFPFLGGDPLETFFIGLTSFSIVPLYLPFVVSIVLFVVTCICSFLMLNLFQAIVLLSISLLFFCLGIMGLYIGRIHLQSRGRPLFNIESKINL